MEERGYPDDRIRDVAISILYESVLKYRFDIWDVISEDVINYVKQNTMVCYGGGFHNCIVQDAIGKALYDRLIKEENI
mgnify:CR=1 FL=1